MIHFVVGTKAQFVKLAPIMVGLKQRDIRFRIVETGQHAMQLERLRRDFGLHQPDFSLCPRSRDVTSLGEGMLWLFRATSACWFRRSWLREKAFPSGGICLIHGDTASTLLGLMAARSAGLQVAHIEAGLRSGSLYDPFPEEAIRRYCMQRADILFAPSSQAADNLRRSRANGTIFITQGNTVADALRLAMPGDEAGVQPDMMPSGDFLLATLHRLETISRKSKLEKAVRLLNRLADRMPMVFVVHRPTERAMHRFGLDRNLHTDIRRLPLVEYSHFVSLMRRAKAVLTDGGSIQEECAILGKPCLILRNRTERPDGLERNARLWNFDDDAAESFWKDLDNLVREPSFPAESPSGKIITVLQQLGFGS